MGDVRRASGTFVAEDPRGEELADKQFVGVVEDLVVLGVVAHPIVARLVPPVLEAEERGLYSSINSGEISGLSR